jgi:hypothetical protein
MGNPSESKPTYELIRLSDVRLDMKRARQFYAVYAKGCHHALSRTLEMTQKRRERLMQIIGAIRYLGLWTDGFMDVALRLLREAETQRIRWSEQSVSKFVREHRSGNQGDL